MSVELLQNKAVEKDVEEEMHKNIYEMNFPVRVYNGLKRANINTVSDLVLRTEEDILKIIRCWRKWFKRNKTKTRRKRFTTKKR